MDQRLRLTAELKDSASPKIRQLGKELKDIRRTPGMEQASKWMTGFNETADGFVKSGAGVSTVMGALGVGGLAAAAGLGGLVEQFKQLGDHTFAMKRLGQQTQMTLNQISRWEYVGQIFRMPTEQIDAALHHYGDAMVDFMRRRGEIFGQLNQVDPGETGKLLGIADPNARFQEIIRWLGTIKDVAARDRWATEFFGSADIDAVLTNGMPAFNKAVEDAAKNAHTLTDEQQKQADGLNSSIVAFQSAWNDLKLSAGSTVFTELKLAADGFRDAFESVKPIIDWVEGERGKSAGQVAADAAGAVAGAAKDAATGKALEIGKRWQDRAADLARARREMQSEDGNALRRNDENPLLHRSAFVTGFDDGGSDGLSGGVKEGVLAAFREWATQSDALKPATSDRPKAIMASYGSDDGLVVGRDGVARPAQSGGGPAVDMKGFGAPHPGKWWTPDRQQHAVDRLMKEGDLSQAGAEGLVSRWANVEAGAGPTAFNRSSGAAGIGQWLGSRKRDFTADFDSQITHAINEGKTTEARAWRKLREARDARDGAIGASMFERAEHYNPHTGADDWTGKSLAGAARVHQDVLAARRTPNLVDEAAKASAPGSSDGTVEAHIHIHDGQVKGASGRASGIVKTPQVNLRRGPTMTMPSIEA